MTGRHGRRASRPMPWSRRSPVWTSGGGRPLPALPARRGRSIFRDEALQARSRGAEIPDVGARLGAPWLSWLYRLALVLVAAGVVLIVTARTAPGGDGTAVVSRPDGRLAAVLPVAMVPELTQASGLSVVLDGSPPIRVTGTRVRLAVPSLVRQAGLAQPSQPSVLLTGRLAPRPVPRLAGGGRHVVTSMALVTRSEPVGAIVVREFEVMLGQGGEGS
jgi:hypothetical protein